MTWEFRNEAEVLELCSRTFSFPDSYAIIDCETTGFSREDDLIIDVGWMVVKENAVLHECSMLLDWSQHDVDHAFLKDQLLRQATEYGRAGRQHHYSWERLCSEGLPPMEVLQAFAMFIYDYINKPGSMVIGHGFWNFDREMIDAHTNKFMGGYVLPWQPDSIFDTGLLEKAAQSLVFPYAGETLDMWYTRINAHHIRVKYNLEGHCVPKYHLIERYGADLAGMHTAACDCRLIYCLYDTYKQLTEVLNGARPALEGRRFA